MSVPPVISVFGLHNYGFLLWNGIQYLSDILADRRWCDMMAQINISPETYQNDKIHNTYQSNLLLSNVSNGIEEKNHSKSQIIRYHHETRTLHHFRSAI